MQEIKKNRIVIWGLKYKYHTHRHIHKAFYENAKKMGFNTIWLEDWKKNKKKILPGDLIISSEVYGKMVKDKNKLSDYNLPIREDVKYCLHNFKDIFKSHLKKENYINLAVYTNAAENSDIKIDEARFFDTKTRTLYQPWGTNLAPDEFKDPVYNKNKFVFWIGSIWNNELNQGNIAEICQLKGALKKFGYYFVHLKYVPDFLNIFFIRRSGIAPAIAGRFQVENNYLPCRVFKNISYGQLGITNVKKFSEIFMENFVPFDNNIHDIKKVLMLNKKDYVNIVKRQQQLIFKYTYIEAIKNINNFVNNE